MQALKISIFCERHDFQAALKKQLANQFTLLFCESLNELIELLTADEIVCLIAYRFQNSACKLWDFREIKAKYELIPLIFICPFNQFEALKACAGSFADEIVYCDEIDQISEIVEKIKPT